MNLYLFDVSDGYPARCLGRFPDSSADPVQVTGNVNAVGAMADLPLRTPNTAITLASDLTVNVDLAATARWKMRSQLARLSAEASGPLVELLVEVVVDLIEENGPAWNALSPRSRMIVDRLRSEVAPILTTGVPEFDAAVAAKIERKDLIDGIPS